MLLSIPHCRKLSVFFALVGFGSLFLSLVCVKLFIQVPLADWSRANALEILYFFPSMFLLDLAVAGSVAVPFLVSESVTLLLQPCSLISGFLLMLTIMSLQGSVVTFYLGSNRVLDWSLLEFVLDDFTEWLPMTNGHLSTFAFTLALQILSVGLWFILLSRPWVTKCAPQQVKRIPERGEVLVGRLPNRVQKNGGKIFVLFCVIYLLSIPIIRPEEPWARLSIPPPIDATYFLFKYLLGKSLPETPIWDSSPPPSFVLPQLKALEDPLNVVLFFLETSRADMVPFNYSSPFAEKNLNAETMKRRDITPFLDTIAKNGYHVPFSRTVNAYTLKSMFAALCGIYPFPDTGNKEFRYSFPTTCLPTLLRDAGYKTAAIQSVEMNFDHQKPLMNKIGFEETISSEDIDQHYESANLDRLAYFGYADAVVTPLIVEWLDKVKEKPFFMTYLTGTTHHPFITPRSWTTKLFTNTEYNEFNGYLNTLNYVDTFLADIFGEFRKLGIMENTLFVFTGDHGLSLRDHDGVFNVHSVTYEEAFRVPLIFYTENKKWKDKLHYRAIDEHTATNLDILPTILNILTADADSDLKDPKLSSALTDAGYEGHSIFENYTERPKFSHGNPGYHSVSYLYNAKKILRQAGASDVVFDLSKDPHEDHPMRKSELPPDMAEWYIQAAHALDTHLHAMYTKWHVDWLQKEQVWPYFNHYVVGLAVVVVLSRCWRIALPSVFQTIRSRDVSSGVV